MGEIKTVTESDLLIVKSKCEEMEEVVVIMT